VREHWVPHRSTSSSASSRHPGSNGSWSSRRSYEKTVQALGGSNAERDTIIDGGNSYFKDDIRRAGQLNLRASTTLTSVPAAACGHRSRLLHDDRGRKTRCSVSIQFSRRWHPGAAKLAARRDEKKSPAAQQRTLHSLWSLASRPFCEDGAQRHRVRMMQAYAEGFDISRRRQQRTPEEHRFTTESAGYRRSLRGVQRWG